jgi:hypothetical protein
MDTGTQRAAYPASPGAIYSARYFTSPPTIV